MQKFNVKAPCVEVAELNSMACGIEVFRFNATIGVVDNLRDKGHLGHGWATNLPPPIIPTAPLPPKHGSLSLPTE
jgi:hypothetical protein